MTTVSNKKNSTLKNIILFIIITISQIVFFALIYASSPYRALRPYSLLGKEKASNNYKNFVREDGTVTIFFDGEETLADFYIDQIPVTIGKYKEYVREKNCAPPHYNGSFEKMWTNNIYEIFPVSFVAWQEARDYCLAHGGDLPTSLQWTYAASFGQGGKYAWGNEMPSLEKSNADGYYQWLTPAGWLPYGASFSGVLDMNGNVREWILNENPDGTGGRGLKGGGSHDSFSDIETENTFYHYSISAGFNRGFRCVYPIASNPENE